MSLSVRDATAADYEVFARLFPELHVPDPVLTAAQFAERMLPEVVIAQDGERPVGWYLNVKADNAPAIRLYERAGLSVEQKGWSLHAPWSALRNLQGPTTALEPEPSAEETSRFAARHGLDPDRLALVRARPLFDALWSHASTPHVNLFVEGDEALADALRQIGATLSFELLRMGASLAPSAQTSAS